jgi:phage-related protein
MADAHELAAVVWEGDSLEALQSFPDRPRHDLGYALYRLQLGQMPGNSRPMQSIGAGVFELREQDERAWYRVIYLKKIRRRIHVLHVFEKRSAKTPRKDFDIARHRLSNVTKRSKEEQHGEE